jgi:hypothetical protein
MILFYIGMSFFVGYCILAGYELSINRPVDVLLSQVKMGFITTSLCMLVVFHFFASAGTPLAGLVCLAALIFVSYKLLNA